MSKTDQKNQNMVIVESPAKASTIKKILGEEYEVEACMGHVRDLPENRFGIDVEDDFSAEYEILEDKKDVLEELKEKAEESEEIYLAPDPDREGEAIAWHLVKALNLDNGGQNGHQVYRVTFNEITDTAVREAFEHPGDISPELVNAQMARRFLDRIVGYRLSPLLWEKIARGLSAGRVQSVALMLLVERDREIEAFEPDEYWEIDAWLHEEPEADLSDLKEKKEEDGDKEEVEGGFEAELFRIDGEKPALENEEEAQEIVDRVEDEPFVVDEVEREEKMDEPGPPFHTSLLQQRAASKLRFSTKKTMTIAQQLYEGVELEGEERVGLITYMRTDSYRISDDAMDEVREVIEDDFGDDYLPDETREFKAQEGAEEAHEAIRPTSTHRTPEELEGYLSEDQMKLYRLIWKRFMASQMSSAVYHNTTVDIAVADCVFRARGRELVFPGYLALMGTEGRKDDQILPELEEDQEVGVIDIIPSQHFTKPPPHYTEASLVRKLENEGIGRPSTYSPILSTIQDRGYVEKDGRSLVSTELGQLVSDKLKNHFSDLMDTRFTSNIEKQLDQIEESEMDWKKVLEDFYKRFEKDLEEAEENMSSEKGREPEEEVTCEECGEPMVIRWNKNGKFLGCSAFPECENTKSLDRPETLGETCPECGEDLVVKSGRRGMFLGCSGYPDCEYTRSMDYLQTEDGTWCKIDFPCDNEDCDGKLVLRTSGSGQRFLGCNEFPDCKNTKSYPDQNKIDQWIDSGLLKRLPESLNAQV